MNWKLIFQLSLFGLAMGLATVFFIPSNVEPLLWLPIFAICAYSIARQCPTMRFWHGLLLGIANSVWITLSHIILFERYLGGHAREAAMMETMKSMPLPSSPRLMMALTGPVIGMISGALIGLLAIMAGKFVSKEEKAVITKA